MTKDETCQQVHLHHAVVVSSMYTPMLNKSSIASPSHIFAPDPECPRRYAVGGDGCGYCGMLRKALSRDSDQRGGGFYG